MCTHLSTWDLVQQDVSVCVCVHAPGGDDGSHTRMRESTEADTTAFESMATARTAQRKQRKARCSCWQAYTVSTHVHAIIVEEKSMAGAHTAQMKQCEGHAAIGTW